MAQLPFTDYARPQIYLHTPYSKGATIAVAGETLTDHWLVSDQFAFENIGLCSMLLALCRHPALCLYFFFLARVISMRIFSFSRDKRGPRG
jgi:hypothetical protein